MKLKDFIDFTNLESENDANFYLLNCDRDNNHKEIECDNENIIMVDKSEILYLITQARYSFMNYIKLKNKYFEIDKDMEGKFYLSSDKKYYCYFLSKSLEDHDMYTFGILEKESGKYLIILWEDGYLFLKNYYYDFVDCERLQCIFYTNVNFQPLVSISYKTNEFLSIKSKPYEIIDTLDDYFNTIYDELYK
ncbi:hypothetical protein H012_gp851 [Acanthamoeba polyphaga moumouvirus]|uniref:Uncharacterized protein n=2 Tax=Moumouvirus TaxID=3080801 RepID=L7RFM9_9VIRU|nr:hypothetical protein H012_gp851 [Acanthamoeba polyphaga moumouvirus]AEX63252.1 hypothetical protein mv_R1050 [Moumouvirus Monve]AGC01615.1 hypothetical protein Moumou_00067 [Acanthamoeba polyphaga moumouvirus]AQN67940.1 hypothetical protein [Saudi moumouvirus]